MIASLILGMILGFCVRLNPTFLSDILEGLISLPLALTTKERYILNFILSFAAMTVLAMVLGLKIYAFSALVGSGIGFFGQKIYRKITDGEPDE